MNDVLIEGEPLELIREAFRGMEARRQADGWVSISGRLDRVPGEALLRALHRAEAHLPRRIGSSREQHRAAALDEIARQFTAATAAPTGCASGPAAAVDVAAEPVERRPSTAPRPHAERARNAADVASERFRRHRARTRHLVSVPPERGPEE